MDTLDIPTEKITTKKIFNSLLVISIVCFLAGIIFMQTSTQKYNKFINDESKKALNGPKLVPISKEQMEMLKDTIDTFSEANSLKLTTIVNNNQLMIKANGEPQNVLADYTGIKNTLKFVSYLPVTGKYKSLCIGEECGFDFIIEIQGN